MFHILHLVLDLLSKCLVPVQGDSKELFSVFESSCHLLLPVLPLKSGSNLVKWLAQGHNKRIYRLVLHNISSMINVKQLTLWVFLSESMS